MGPWAYVQHLLSTPRLPFTAAYFGSIGMTLYFAIGVSQPYLVPLGLDLPKMGFVLTPSAAPEHHSHLVLRHHPTGMPCMVFNQLFPNGFEWLETCGHIRGSKGCGLDDRLENTHMKC